MSELFEAVFLTMGMEVPPLPDETSATTARPSRVRRKSRPAGQLNLFASWACE